MSIVKSIRSQLAPIHPEGYPFIGGFALATLILFWLWTPLGWIGAVLTIWCALFFRDPVRITPVRDGVGAPGEPPRGAELACRAGGMRFDQQCPCTRHLVVLAEKGRGPARLLQCARQPSGTLQHLRAAKLDEGDTKEPAAKNASATKKK